jgi:hypothetical protein
MDKHIEKKLKKLEVEPDSALGVALIALYEVYSKTEDIEKQVEYLLDQRQQLKEDAEVMEMMLMYKFNKDTRVQKWVTSK